jgi:Flp pilus assembly protein protease CpaA
MPAVSRADGLTETWRRLNPEQRVAGIGAVLLIVSTFGPFSFVEAGIVVTGGAVLYLLKKRADGALFHLPFGDGSVIAAAGAWSGLLIVVRLFDRPLGQNLLALVCAAILLLAGLRERSRRPMDDIAQPKAPGRERAATRQRPSAAADDPGITAETEALPAMTAAGARRGRKRRRPR